MASSKTIPAPHHQSSSSSSLLPLWMRQSLEHLSMKTNMEEYGTSPPESENLFLHDGKLPTYSMAIPNVTGKPMEGGSGSSSSGYGGLVFRAKELVAVPRQPPRALSVVPTSSRPAYLSSSNVSGGDQVCPSVSAPASAATTPSVTPQHSPTLIRKILTADLTASSSHCKAGHSVTDSGNRKAALRVVPVTRVTNFDLNAVSPTSW